MFNWKKKNTYVHFEIVEFENFSWRLFVCYVAEYFKIATIPFNGPNFVPEMRSLV